MEIRQEIIKKYQDGDYRERLELFFMYRYFRNEFLEIESKGKKTRTEKNPYSSLTNRSLTMPILYPSQLRSRKNLM